MDRVRRYWDMGNGFSARDGWHWHPRMSTSLAQQGYTDEELFHLYERRQRFRELLILRGQRAEALAYLRLRATSNLARILNLEAEVRVLDIDATRATHAKPLTAHPEFDKWQYGTQTGELWAAVGDDWVSGSPGAEGKAS